jgi:hypothetical protein
LDLTVSKHTEEQNDDMTKDDCHHPLLTVVTCCNVSGRDPLAENEMFRAVARLSLLPALNTVVSFKRSDPNCSRVPNKPEGELNFK